MTQNHCRKIERGHIHNKYYKLVFLIQSIDWCNLNSNLILYNLLSFFLSLISQMTCILFTYLLILFCLHFMNFVAGNRAKEYDYSQFPSNWCDNRFGKPTRTTAECVCFGSCIGPKCQNIDGFIFYSYIDCPTCQCTAGISSKEFHIDKEPVDFKDDGNEVGLDYLDINPNVNVKKKQKKSDIYESYQDESRRDTEESEPFNLIYFVQDHWRLIFVGLVMFGFVSVVIIGGYVSAEREKKNLSHDNINTEKRS